VNHAYRTADIEFFNSLLEPHIIPDDRPRWEDRLEQIDRVQVLREERRQLHKAEALIDRAEERIAEGNVTKDEIEDLRNEIEGALPPSARVKVGLPPMPDLRKGWKSGQLAPSGIDDLSLPSGQVPDSSPQ
jgi:hypothetical protein